MRLIEEGSTRLTAATCIRAIDDSPFKWSRGGFRQPLGPTTFGPRDAGDPPQDGLRAVFQEMWPVYLPGDMAALTDS